MAALPNPFRLLPKPVRSALRRALDSAVPPRLRLPYLYLQYRLQDALEDEMRLLPRLTRSDGVAIDIGANIGLYSYRLHKLCRRVEAFEPNPACLSVLEAYAAANVRAHRVALSSQAGTIALNIPVVGGVAQAAFGSARVPKGVAYDSIGAPTRRLDDFHIEDVCFIKIDVEGHELEVLEGAAETIRRQLPVLLIEIEDRHQPAGMQAVFSVVAAHGYRGFFMFEDAIRPLERFDVAYHQRAYLEGRQTIKYVNNFIFLPPGQVQLMSDFLETH